MQNFSINWKQRVYNIMMGGGGAMQQSQNSFNPQDMYHMFDLEVLENNIWYFKNVLSYPEDLLKFIEQLNEEETSYEAISQWEDWNASDNHSVVYGSKKQINTNQIPSNANSHTVGSKSLYVKNSFVMAAELSIDRYLAGHSLDKNHYSLPIDYIPIRRWGAGTNMGPHCDNYDGHTNLAFSMITYINDDFSGGELFFPNQNIMVKPKAGSLIIFPSVEPYLHQVETILNGSRHTSHLSVWRK